MSRGNLAEALRRLEHHAGAPGIDGTTTRAAAVVAWPLAAGPLSARRGYPPPQPVRRLTIPSPRAGSAMLGVPAAVDRLICQAIAQVLTPVFDPHFHPYSFGYWPGRLQHHAVEWARQFIADGAAGAPILIWTRSSIASSTTR